MMWGIFRMNVADAMLPTAALMVLSSLIAFFADGTVEEVALVLCIVFTASWTVMLSL